MDDLVAEMMKIGLLEAKSQGDEVGRFVSVIQRFTEAVSVEREATAACRHFLRILIEETEFENCSILLWDKDLGKLCLAAAYGLDDQFEVVRRRYRHELRFRPGENIAGQVFSSEKAVFIENSSDKSIPEIQNSVVTPVSLACVPILQIGVLNLSASRPQEFSPMLRRNWETVGKIIGHLVVGLQGIPGSSHQSAFNPAERSKTNGNGQHPISDLVLDFMPQGICVLDTQGKIVRTNRSIANIQGQKLPEIVGRSPSVLFQNPAVFDKLLVKASEPEGGRVEKTDVSLMNSKGETYAADINLVKLSEAGKWVGYLLVIEDMTRKKAFSDKIIQSEKLAALGTMAGGVSHDFNNLLMAILGHIQLILPEIEDEEIRRRLQSIEKAVFDGSNTVRRLQRFTERERDPNAAVPVVDIDEAVKDVVELTRPRWKNLMERSGRTIDIRRDIQQNSLAAINASDLREVLTNLLLNAIDAMPQGGRHNFPFPPSWRAAFPGGERHGHRHGQGGIRADIRSFFHHQGNRELGAWTERVMEPDQQIWGRHSGKEQGGQRHDIRHKTDQGRTAKKSAGSEDRRGSKFVSTDAGRRRPGDTQPAAGYAKAQGTPGRGA